MARKTVDELVATWERLSKESRIYNSQLIAEHGTPDEAGEISAHQISLSLAKISAEKSAWDDIPKWKRDQILDSMAR